MVTANKQCTIKIRAVPLPPEVTLYLDSNNELIKAIDRNLQLRDKVLVERLEKLSLKEEDMLSDKTDKAIDTLKSNLGSLFDKAGGEWTGSIVEQIWSFGPRRCGANLLINRIPGNC